MLLLVKNVSHLRHDFNHSFECFSILGNECDYDIGTPILGVTCEFKKEKDKIVKIRHLRSGKRKIRKK